jgi:hypothetical protein
MKRYGCIQSKKVNMNNTALMGHLNVKTTLENEGLEYVITKHELG